MSRRARNDRLRDLLTAAGWSFDSLARAVNSAGAEAGLQLRYDRTAVAHWISGTRPRAQVPALITEALTRRLGRPVTPAELGFDLAAPGPMSIRPGGGTAALADLVCADLDPVGHRLLARSVYRLDELAVPAWLEEAQEDRGNARGALARIDVTQHMVEVFAAINHRFGSGHARTALTAYLADDVLPHLAGPEIESGYRELLGSAIDLVVLIGFACFDSNEHGLAQRYYRVALDLAVLDRDAVRYAIVLRALSHQACHLGHGTPALELALAALSAGDRQATPHTSAFLHAQVSLSYAVLGRGEAALASHQRARDSLSRAVGPSPTFGSYHRGELNYHAASIRVFDGDISGAVTALRSALRHYPSAERRSRALTLAELAERQLDLGLLSRACATAHRFLDDSPNLCSGRVSTAMRSLRERLQQFRRNSEARSFVRRSSAIPAFTRPGS
ncbi:tetratricopeptide repeat protein [Amycolatopsis sp. cmx-11-12]|uniref:tetratricopeptide repeat protein n=1 Tax=Amycolatopsis sp. cmx-11-12 TaxID=2785795 RepID=UPI003916D212